MKPTLWGPPLWQAMFSCAWVCPPCSVDVLRDMLLEQLPLLLPCPKCRDHFAEHLPRVHRRAKGSPQSAEHAFRWLYLLKDEVNKSLQRRSVPLEDVVERHVFHGGVVDDVALGDVLVLMALNAVRLHREEIFVRFCHALATLLPLPDDSQFAQVLSGISQTRARNVVPSAVRAARAARVERGLPAKPLAHYEAIVAEP